MNNNYAAYSYAYWYSIAQGFSCACDTLYSIKRKTSNYLEASVVAVIVGVLEAFTSHRFQGQSILAANTREDQKGKFVNPKKNVCASIFLQSIFLLFKTGVALANRYFVMAALEDHYEFEFGPYLFWSILTTDLIINRLFCLSNEDYESSEYIANRFGYETPCHALMFKPFAGRTARLWFSGTGSLEHVLIDDLLSLVLLLPTTAISFLKNNFVPKLIAGTIGIIASLLAAYPLFQQAFLFEGGHTRDHLAKLAGQKDTYAEDTKIARWKASILRGASNAMAPLHGIASAVSIYFALQEACGIYAAAALASFVFFGVTAGVYQSETREAKEKIDEMESSNRLLLN